MDPFTISAGIAAISSLFKGITGFFSGNRQAQALKAQAAQTREEAGVASSQALQQGDVAAAQAAVQGAANGGGFVGSTLGVIQDLSSRAMFNARAAAYRGGTQAQASLYQAKVAKAQATSGLVGSLFGAAGDIYGGMAKSDLYSKQTAALKALRGDAASDPLNGLS